METVPEVLKPLDEKAMKSKVFPEVTVSLPLLVKFLLLGKMVRVPLLARIVRLLGRPMEPFPIPPPPSIVLWLMSTSFGDIAVMRFPLLFDITSIPLPDSVSLDALMVSWVPPPVEFRENVPALTIEELAMVRKPALSIFTWPPVGLVSLPLIVLLPEEPTTSMVPVELLVKEVLMVAPPIVPPSLMVPPPAWASVPPSMMTLFSRMSVLELLF